MSYSLANGKGVYWGWIVASFVCLWLGSADDLIDI